jgi:hypothetical protein
MCFSNSSIKNLYRWNWDGDMIVFDSQVPSARPVVGAHSLKRQYPIDVREFLVSENNAVMRMTLEGDVQQFIKEVKGDGALFKARKERAFDHRAHMIAAYVASRIKYRSRHGRDPWQFPDETLFLKSGDCEDRAFLIASLMLASGISNYNVRVAIGKVHHCRQNQPYREYDHAWVMYKSEAGQWLLLEPLQIDVPKPDKRQRQGPWPGDEEIEYVPYFLFNDRHLWRVKGPETPTNFGHVCAREWSRINPKFAGAVHQTILQEALGQNIAPQWVIDGINRFFHRILFVSPVIDDVDNPFLHSYDPREHFDNGYIREGWDLVKQHLDAFQQDNHDLWSFALAAHTIADFYGHTSYLHFAKLINPENSKTGHAPAFAPEALDDPVKLRALVEALPDYQKGSSFDLADATKYSINAAVWKKDRAEVPCQWKGKLISGRYAQAGDSRDLPETLVGIPAALEHAGDFAVRGSLQHHNEIAVDDEKPKKTHKLYGPGMFDGKDRLRFANQFQWRKNSAREHIRLAFTSNWRPA